MIDPHVIKHLELHYLKELEAFSLYWTLSLFFHQPKVNLPGFSKFFGCESESELGHAQEFAEFVLNLAHTSTVSIKTSIPTCEIITVTPLEALNMAIDAEKKILNNLELIHGDDSYVDEFLDKFIKEQFDSIEKLTRMIVEVEACGNNDFFLRQLDRELLKSLSN